MLRYLSKAICGSLIVAHLGACSKTESFPNAVSNDSLKYSPAQPEITDSDRAASEARLDAFVNGKYDPLTTPVEWFTPIRKVGSVTTAEMRRASVVPANLQDGIEQAKRYAKSQGSLALIVAKDGEIISETYWQDADSDTLFNPQSMSKTLLALLVGVAIDEGDIKSVNDPIKTYLSEFEDDPRGNITIKNLLQMSAGLEQITNTYEITPENRGVRQHFGPDFIGPMLELTVVDPPGAKWEYNNNETQMLAYVLQRATGVEYASYLSDKLWKPLQLGEASMYLDREGGNVLTSCCILSRPVDWVKIGQLIIDKGRYKDQQIIPASWIEEMLTPAETWEGYGYQVWIGDRFISDERPENDNKNFVWASTPHINQNIIYLSGYGFQRVWIVPSENLVIMRASKTWPKKWDESLIPNAIVSF